MYPVIDLGFLQIPMYGLMAVIGFTVAIFVFSRICVNYKIEKSDGLFAGIYGLIGLMIGAKALFAITLLPKVISHFDIALKYPGDTIMYLFGGWVFYGGLIGLFVGIFIYCRTYKIDFLNLISVMAPVIPLFHAFGRTGCLLSGCCYGQEYDGIFSITFPRNQYTIESFGVSRFPTQPIEIIFNLILFFVLLEVLKRSKVKGRALGLYLISYSILRFSLEFFRGDVIRGNIYSLSTSQIISILILPVGIYLFSGKINKKGAAH